MVRTCLLQVGRAALGISGNRHVVLPPRLGGLVDGQFANFREVRLRQRLTRRVKARLNDIPRHLPAAGRNSHQAPPQKAVPIALSYPLHLGHQ